MPDDGMIPPVKARPVNVITLIMLGQLTLAAGCVLVVWAIETAVR